MIIHRHEVRRWSQSNIHQPLSCLSFFLQPSHYENLFGVFVLLQTHFCVVVLDSFWSLAFVSDYVLMVDAAMKLAVYKRFSPVRAFSGLSDDKVLRGAGEIEPTQPSFSYR